MAVQTNTASKLRVAFLTAAMVAVAGIGISQEQRASHPDTYVVKRGDTLWGIAARFLKKPWLWPEIWQANPQVRNPHLIYPGDVLSLSYLNRVQAQPGPRTEAPIPGIPLGDVEAFLRDMRIYDSIDDLPHVVALNEERLLGTEGQTVYVRGLADAQPGQRFAILRMVQNYTLGTRTNNTGYIVGRDDLARTGRPKQDPDYQRAWTEVLVVEGQAEKLGTELRKVNAGAVIRGEGGGVEVTTLKLDDPSYEVRVGDKVVPVESIPYDPYFVPHPPKSDFPYGRARVLSVSDRNTVAGPRDVVALSVGSRDGVDNGTVFSMWRVGSNTVDRVRVPERTSELVNNRDKLRLPDEFAGHVMVFRTFDKVSYGLVMESVRPSRAGYELKHPDTPRE